MKLFYVAIAFIFTTSLTAQENTITDPQVPSVEKSIFGIQTGLVGIWGYNEARLSDKIALRSEVGFDLGVAVGMYIDDIYVLYPVINAEPRYYYNLDRRVRKDKNIQNNSGNFLALKAMFAPDWFLLGSDRVKPINQLAIVPKYGLRRVYGKHFTLEAGLGIGFVTQFGKNERYYADTSDAYFDLHARIGYSF